jgi:hypothetical protein
MREKGIVWTGNKTDFQEGNAQMSGSEENKRLFELMGVVNRYELRFLTVKKQAQNIYSVDSHYQAKSKKIGEERTQIRKAMNQDLARLVAQAPQSEIFRQVLPLFLHPLQEDKPEWQKHYDNYSAFQYDHFFSRIDAVNFLPDSPFFYRKLNEYFQQFGNVDDLYLQKRMIARLAEWSAPNPELKDLVLGLLLDRLYNRQAHAAAEFLEKEYLSGCELGTGIQASLEKIEKLKTGKTFPDWELPAGQSAHTHLHQLFRNSGKKSAVVVWSGTCRHCQDQLQHWKTYSESETGKNYNWIWISLDTDKQVWERMKQKLPVGHHFCDLQGPAGPIVERYNIRFTPSFYAISPEGTILGRAKTWTELSELLSGNR